MQRPQGQQPNRPPVPGYPQQYGQPAAAITYQLNGAQVGRGNTLNIVGSGITFTPGPDKGTYNISGSGGGVTQIIAGTNISISPIGGTGAVTINATGAGFSPYTIENGDSIFSTGLPGVWNSTATKSFISGVNAGDNADAVDSFIAIGELAGASDDAVPYLPHNSNFIGNRAGYNAHDAIDATFLGHLAGAYAEYASYSFFAGAQAGISATYAGNSFMFGQAAGHNATNAAYSTFIGLEAGYDGTNDGFSSFIGNLAGFQAGNANNATFIGSQAGRADTVNNAGTITYTGASGTFSPVAVITTPGGGRAYVISDNGAGTLTVMDSNGAFDPLDVITEFPSGITATVSTYTPSTSSILIGDHTSTGGGKNSVAIGAHSTNAGFNNSIVIGVGGANDADNQYAWGDSIINWKFGGNNYQLPFYLPSGSGQYLGASPGGVLNWSVPGSTVSSLSVLAATTTVLPFSPGYSNGAAGVGATLTASSNGILIVDGVTIPLNGRVLVKDELALETNGVYQLSTVGTGGVPYVLTRTTDADMATDFDDMVVIPAQGTQSATPFAEINFVTTIGIDPIVFAPQSSLYLRQQAAGTQAANQIPVYTGTALTVTKGTDAFTFDPTTNLFKIKDTNLDTVFRVNTALQYVSMGDVDNVGSQAKLEVAGGGQIFATIPGVNGIFGIVDESSNYFIEINNATQTYSIGDTNALYNGTNIQIADAGQQIAFTGVKFKFTSLQDFANNAAAIGGGLTTGDLYYTSSGGDGLVKVVI